MLRGFIVLLVLLGLAGYYVYDFAINKYEPKIPQGDASVQVQVGNFSLRDVQLKNISVTAKFPANFTDYPEDLQALLRQKMKALSIGTIQLPYNGGQVFLEGITLTFTPKEGGKKWQGTWKMAAFSMSRSPYPMPLLSGSGSFTADTQSVQLSGKLKDVSNTHNVQFSVNYNVENPQKTVIALNGGQLPFEGGTVKLKSGSVKLGGKELFRGTVTLDKISLARVAAKYMDSKLESKSTISGTLPVRYYTNGTVQLTNASLKDSEGGSLKIQTGEIKPDAKELFKGVLLLSDIPLSGLLSSLMEGKATATGNVSGTLPLVVRSSGTPIVKGAKLTTIGGGTIKLAPDTFPKGNEQLVLVGDVLANFHYKDLIVTLDSDKDEKLAATLKIEGNNPDLYEGRVVKLNVQLTGDLLSLIQQSVFAISDPKSLLKKGKK